MLLGTTTPARTQLQPFHIENSKVLCDTAGTHVCQVFGYRNEHGVCGSHQCFQEVCAHSTGFTTVRSKRALIRTHATYTNLPVNRRHCTRCNRVVSFTGSILLSQNA